MRRRRKAACSILVAGTGLALLFSTPVAHATSAPVPAGTATLASALSHERMQRLAALIPAPGPIELRGDRAMFPVNFNLSSRIEPTAAKLHLVASNSNALLRQRSQLLVRLNDVIVAQIQLNPEAPLTIADIDVPVELLRGGVNRLVFAVAQHYTDGCENPDAAELWTQIDTTRSTLTLAGHLAEATPHLSDLPDLIGPGFFGGRRFTLMTPAPTGGASDAAVSTGAVLAQALALRLRWQPPEIAFAPATPAAKPPSSGQQQLRLAASSDADETGDIVLFGTKDQLAPLLGPTVEPVIGPGGFLGIYKLGDDTDRLALVVSGITEQDVLRSASALAVMNFPLVDTQQQSVDRVDDNRAASFVPQRNLVEGKLVSFSDLGLHTTTLQGTDGSLRLDVAVPADYYVPDTAKAQIMLDFAYGAGLRPDSVVNVKINDEFQQSLALSDPNGAVLRGYRIDVPARRLHPGQNSITLEAAMRVAVAGACASRGSGNLLMSVADTSSITLPEGEHITSQPNLQLFARTGFPYVGSDGFDVVLAARDPATVGAGWTLLARLAQLSGRSLADLRMLVGNADTGRNSLIIGAVPDLTPALTAGSPVVLSPEASLPYASATPLLAAPSKSWRQTVWEFFGNTAYAGRIEQGPDLSRTEGRAELGRLGLLTAYESAAGNAHTTTLLTAATPRALWTVTQDMVAPNVWYQLAKDMTVWRPGLEGVSSQRVGPQYHMGTHNLIYAARYYIGEYPARWIASVAAFALIFALMLRLVLTRRRRHAFPGSTEGVP